MVLSGLRHHRRESSKRGKRLWSIHPPIFKVLWTRTTPSSSSFSGFLRLLPTFLWFLILATNSNFGKQSISGQEFWLWFMFVIFYCFCLFREGFIFIFIFFHEKQEAFALFRLKNCGFVEFEVADNWGRCLCWWLRLSIFQFIIFFNYFRIPLKSWTHGLCTLKVMSCSIGLKRELVLFHFAPKRKFNHIGVSKQQNLSESFCSQ